VRHTRARTRVDENLAYVVGLDCESAIHANTDCSYAPGFSDFCRYESVNKHHETVSIEAAYFAATVYQGVSSDLVHRQVTVTVTLCGYNTLYVMVMLRDYLCKSQISRRNVNSKSYVNKR
jgi:hypothetical protein